MDYYQETKAPLGDRAAYLEASRCLLCLDAPCSKACPAGTDPARFIRSLRFKNKEGAASTIRINNALGAICARVCPTETLCQQGCIRAGLDAPIDIGGIQAYLTDLERKEGWSFVEAGKENGKKVAIVGSGPAGLSAAYTLRQLGYGVTIYEKEEKAGGVLRYGIPEYRLPSFVLDYEVKRIEDLGTKFVFGKTVGKDIDPEELKKEYDAVLYCIGFGLGKVIDVFEGKENVVTAVSLLREIRLDPKAFEVPKTALVVGGGDVAMDAVTSLKKLGTKKVICVAYEELGEFRASKEEFNFALKNCDSLVAGYTPTAMEDGIVTFRHRHLDSELQVKADLVVLGLGQYADFGGLPLTSDRGLAQGKFHMTDDPKVFFAGDISDEKGKLVVYAVKSGKEAALIIDKRIGGGK